MDFLAFSVDPPGQDDPEDEQEQARVDRLVRDIQDLIQRRDRGKITPKQFLSLQNEKLREIEEIGDRLEREGRARPRIDLGQEGK